ncbi:hypothetical protein BDZ89DRAFT_119454 [Hymenopellis radicata]|nr:hypothetical protein BDZ89DRAFT_119454 [Hymenopellis radicata]
MKGVDFDLPKMGRFKRLAHNITAVLGIGGPVRSRDPIQAETSKTATPSPNIPTRGPSRLGRHRTVVDIARRTKGKGKDLDRSLSRLRNSASISRRSSQKSRKEKEVVEPGTPPPSSGGLISFMFFGRGGSKNTLTPKASSPDNGAAPLPAIKKSRSYNKSRGGPAARASAEVLGAHPAALTNSRRVSSWGDHPTELKNTSFDDDEDITEGGALQFGRPSLGSDDDSLDSICPRRGGAVLFASLRPRRRRPYGRALAFRASCSRWLTSLTMALSRRR